MKNYFDFTLTGKKLLPIWLIFLIAFWAPYFTLIIQMNNIQPGTKPPLFIFPLLLLLIIIAFAVTFYITKMAIENVSFKGQSIVFKGTFGKFFGTVLLGLFLSIITLGIYTAWFIRNLHRYYIDNSSFDSQEFKFQGKGGKLFVIILLTVIIPVIVLSIIIGRTMMNDPENMKSAMIIQQLVTFIILIPYMYLIYKWMVNIDYKGLTISWETNFWSSCGKILIEFILVIITLGIYMPMAWLRLYKYFTDKTVLTNSDRRLVFGFDKAQLSDFLFIWGQVLLTIITLSLYYPWAFSKVGKRILSKTYLEEA